MCPCKISEFRKIINPVSDQFSFTRVECSQVKDIVNSIPNKKAPGIDKVSPRLIKENLAIIVPSITSIINASLRSRVFATSWIRKIAKVWPILKRNSDHEEASNYRPIPLLPILSKVCERVVQLTLYLASNQRIQWNRAATKDGTLPKRRQFLPLILFSALSTRRKLLRSYILIWAKLLTL